MGSHIMSALEDIISSHIASNPEPAMQEGWESRFLIRRFGSPRKTPRAGRVVGLFAIV
jgi:hypothetical protein